MTIKAVAETAGNSFIRTVTSNYSRTVMHSTRLEPFLQHHIAERQHFTHISQLQYWYGIAHKINARKKVIGMGNKSIYTNNATVSLIKFHTFIIHMHIAK